MLLLLKKWLLWESEPRISQLQLNTDTPSLSLFLLFKNGSHAAHLTAADTPGLDGV